MRNIQSRVVVRVEFIEDKEKHNTKNMRTPVCKLMRPIDDELIRKHICPEKRQQKTKT